MSKINVYFIFPTRVEWTFSGPKQGLRTNYTLDCVGGGGGRAWFPRTIVFAVRNKLDGTLDRIPLKCPCRGWANPAENGTERKPIRDHENGAIVRKSSAQPMGNPSDARVMPGHRSSPPCAAAGRKLSSRWASSVAVAHAWTFLEPNEDEQLRQVM